MLEFLKKIADSFFGNTGVETIEKSKNVIPKKYTDMALTSYRDAAKKNT